MSHGNKPSDICMPISKGSAGVEQRVLNSRLISRQFNHESTNQSFTSLAWKIPYDLLDVQFKDECEVTSSILEFCVLQNGQNVMWLFFFKSSATDPPFWRWLSFSFISLARPEENIWFIWYEAISGQDCNSRTIVGPRLEPDNHPEPEWTLLY